VPVLPTVRSVLPTGITGRLWATRKLLPRVVGYPHTCPMPESGVYRSDRLPISPPSAASGRLSETGVGQQGEQAKESTKSRRTNTESSKTTGGWKSPLKDRRHAIRRRTGQAVRQSAPPQTFAVARQYRRTGGAYAGLATTAAKGQSRILGGFKWSSQQDLLAYRATRQTDPAFAHREARDLAS
jgi:hypothetical protein